MEFFASLIVAVNLAFGVSFGCLPEIRDQNGQTHEGWHPSGSNQIYLQRALCQRLVFLREDPRFPKGRTEQSLFFRAVFVLGHELGHYKLMGHVAGLSKEEQEFAADCYSSRVFMMVGRRIGIADHKLRQMRTYDVWRGNPFCTKGR